MNLKQAQYSAQQLAAASGLSRVLVQQYSDRGVLYSESVHVGNRTYRRFDYVEVVAAATIATLRNLGVGPSEVAKYARSAVSQWVYAIRGDADERKMFDHIAHARFTVLQESRSPFFSPGEITLAKTMDAKVADYAIGEKPAMGKPCAFIAIDMETIEREVRARLKQI